MQMRGEANSPAKNIPAKDGLNSGEFQIEKNKLVGNEAQF